MPGRGDVIFGAAETESGVLTNRSVVLLLFGHSRVDDVLDAGNGDGGFGDIGSEDDLAILWWCGSESLGLLTGSELGVKRADEDLERAGSQHGKEGREFKQRLTLSLVG